jgi:TrmH family RNA methyltransferase
MVYQTIGISHPIIKEIRDYKKRPNNSKMLIIEDLFTLELRYKYNFKVITFLFCDELIFSDNAKKIKSFYLGISEKTFSISEKTYHLISEKENAVGMMAVVELELRDLNKIDINKNQFILVTDGIEIPGNLGTIFRTADAVNVDLIINVDSRTSIYNPKTIISSRGMCLKVPFINTTYEEAQKFLLDNNYRIFLGEPELGMDYSKVDYNGNIAIVIGSERFGINKNWYDNEHEEIYIPMYGEMKSLNVGVATSILLYEAKNKRISK